MNRISALFLICSMALLTACNDEQSALNDGGVAPVTVVPSLSIRSSQDQKIITLTWSAQVGSTEYRVFWNTQGNVSELDQRVVVYDKLQYRHTAVQSGVTYYYRIQAVQENGTVGPLSLEASAQVGELLVLDDAAE